MAVVLLVSRSEDTTVVGYELQSFSDALARFGVDVVVAGVVVFLLLKLFLPGYLSEEGKHLATREDFHALLEQLKKATKETESIKAELPSRHWLNHRQWSIRERRYMDLLTNLTKLRLTLQDRNDYYMELGSEHDDESEHFKELTRTGYESLRAVREQIGATMRWPLERHFA